MEFLIAAERSLVFGILKAFCSDAAIAPGSKEGRTNPFSGVKISCPPFVLEERTKTPIASASTVTLAKGS